MLNQIPFGPNEPFTFKQVYDPAIYLLFAGFGLMIVLVAFRYAIAWRNKGQR
jgi:hypothetical protein